MFLDFLVKLFSKIFLFTGKLESKNAFAKRLKPEEEKELFKRIESAKELKKSDPEAEEKLVKHNLRLVAHIASKYKFSGIDQDDLISVGSIGLIKAVRNYSTSKANSFSTFASVCIENEILMLLRSEKKRQSDISLESQIGTDKDGNELCLKDILSDPTTDITAIVSKNISIKKIEDSAKKILDKRELFIITHRFGLFSKRPKTQKEVADKLNISRSYISRIEKTALEKLIKEINAKK